MSYVLNKVNNESLNILRDKWIAQACSFDDIADYIHGDVQRVISWCEKNIDDDTEQCMWILSDEGSSEPRALVEMTDARRSKDPAFKFLKIHFEPNMALDYKESISQEDIGEVFKILAYSLMQSFKTAMDHGANKLKIFARTQEMLNVFDAILLQSNSLGVNIKAYREGKWLIIKTTR